MYSASSAITYTIQRLSKKSKSSAVKPLVPFDFDGPFDAAVAAGGALTVCCGCDGGGSDKKSANGSDGAARTCSPGLAMLGEALFTRGGGAMDILLFCPCGGGCSGETAFFLARLFASYEVSIDGHHATFTTNTTCR